MPLTCSVPRSVDAATVVTHGSPAAVVAGSGPSLPAERFTETPASAANRNAMSTGSMNEKDVPTEKLMTSTPSATAASAAAALSAKSQPACGAPSACQQAL